MADAQTLALRIQLEGGKVVKAEVEEIKGKMVDLAKTGGLLITLNQTWELLQRSINAVKSSLSKFIDASLDQERSLKFLQQTLRTTGREYEFSVEKLHEYAGKLQETTNFGDEQIERAMTTLLSFKNITKDTFDTALKYAADLASSPFGNGDIASAAWTIGMALEKPYESSRMLRYMGIRLTETQEEMLKRMQATGDIAGAQAMLLDLFRQKIGGFSEAMVSPFAQLKNAMCDFYEAVGNFIVPVAKQIASVSIKIVKFLTDLVSTFRKAPTPLKAFTAALVIAGAVLMATAITTQVGTTLMQISMIKTAATFISALKATTVALMTNPIGLILTGIAAVVALFYVAWKKNWLNIHAVIDWISRQFRVAWAAIVGVIKAGVNITITYYKSLGQFLYASVKFFMTLMNPANWFKPGKIKEAFNEYKKSVAESTQAVADAAKQGLEQVADGVKQATDKITTTTAQSVNRYQGFIEALRGLGTGGKTPEQIEAEKEQLRNYQDKYKELLVERLNLLGKEFEAQRVEARKAFEDRKKQYEDEFKEGKLTQEKMNELIAEARQNLNIKLQDIDKKELERRQKTLDELAEAEYQAGQKSLDDYILYLQQRLSAMKIETDEEKTEYLKLQQKINELQKKRTEDAQKQAETLLDLDRTLYYKRTELMGSQAEKERIQREKEAEDFYNTMKQKLDASGLTGEAYTSRLAEITEIANKMKEPVSEVQQMTQDIAEGLQESFTSTFDNILKGTENVKSALIGLGRSVVDVFVNNVGKKMAGMIFDADKGLVKSIAVKLANAVASLFQWFTSALGPLGIPAAIATATLLIAAFNKLRKVIGFAQGGIYASGPSLLVPLTAGYPTALVGERGPEYIIPEQKFKTMAGGVQNYYHYEFKSVVGQYEELHRQLKKTERERQFNMRGG